MDGIVIGIDPGVHTGYAVFAAWRLVWCSLGEEPGYRGTVVIERPQVYRQRLQRGDPNDLIDLAIRVGRHVERAEIAGARVELVLPATWKGQVPKEVHGARTLAALLPEEREALDAVRCAKSLRHNIVDAIGLGLWWLQKEGIRDRNYRQ